MEKKQLRANIRACLRNLSTNMRKQESEIVLQKIISLEQWKTANIVLLFSPLCDEVDISALIDKAHDESKVVLLPVVVGDRLLLHVYNESMHLGAFDILEPDGPQFTAYEKVDLAIVPGLAFDRNGNRLGRGKGYYDRLLPFLRAYKVGACFSFQFVESVPYNDMDVKMDCVVFGDTI